MNGGIFHGFDFRSTQPCLRVRLKLSADKIGDLSRIDAWLTDRVHIDLEEHVAGSAAATGSAEDIVRTAIDRALLVYGELARAANFPCFDPGQLVSLEPIPGEADGLAAMVALPVIDNVPTETFVNLFTEAVRAVRIFSHTRPEQGSEILARLENVVADVARSFPFPEMAVPICRIAHQHDIPFRHLGNTYMRFGIGSAGELAQHSSVQADSAVGATICVDKRVTARILRAAGLPGAEHITVTSPEGACAAARRLGWPVVVKPADRERSKGVTAGITDEAALLAAYDRARDKSANIIVERHVAGTCHRILVAANKVLYVVNRLPKRVKGNGRDSIATLVDVANARRDALPPWKQFLPHVLDSLALECLAADGFTPNSVPDEGQFAYIRPLATPEWGGEVEDLGRDIHPENAELAIAASRLLGLEVAGVDLITTDISRPWHATGAIINEMNFRPQFSVEQREIDTAIMARVLAPGTGRIPVHLITGSGDLASAAHRLWQRRAGPGHGCHVTSATSTRGPDGRELHVAASTLFERTLALTMRADVREVIMIGRVEELLTKGLAVDRVDSLTVVAPDSERAERLLQQLQARFVARSVSISAS